jgi:hypothetical protein
MMPSNTRRRTAWLGLTALLGTAFTLAFAATLHAQVVSDPRIAEFVPSADHSVVLPSGQPAVLRYDLEFYLLGALAPFETVNMGKPSPDADGKIRFDFSSLVAGGHLPGGALDEARVSAVGPAGEAPSNPSNSFSFTTTCPISLSATSAPPMTLSWSAVVGATSYEVWRSSFNGAFSLVLTTAATSVNDTGLSADTTYLYSVRPVGAASSCFSPVDAATTTVFTDASLSGVMIKAAHVTQLRTAVNAMRAAGGLPAAVFTDPTLAAGSTMVKRVHVTELRAALDAARAAIGLAALGYTDPVITAGSTMLKAVHITQLRAGTQ